ATRRKSSIAFEQASGTSSRAPSVADALSITFVSPFAARAGSGRYLGLVLDGLPADWVQQVVFLEDGPFMEEVRERGHRVTVLPTSAHLPGLLRSARRLRPLLLRA